MTEQISPISNPSQTNWPMLLRAKNFIVDEKNTTFKIVKLLSSIIIFPLALFLDLTYKGAKFCWTGFSEYIKQSLAKKREPTKKSLIQKIKTIWTNHKRIISITIAGVILSACFVFLYSNRPLIPNANLAREYENKLIKIAKANEAREKCIKSVQESFIQEREKIDKRYQEISEYQKLNPLVDKDSRPKRITTVEEIKQADKELTYNTDWAIDECNKKFFQDIAEPLWSIKNKKTYFQNSFFKYLNILKR